jgi:hypothetical protein
MFADPQTVTINAVATPLVRTLLASGQGEFTSSDGNVKLTTKQNQTGTRFRREIRLSQQKISPDPISALNTSKGVSVYFVIDEPKTGFSDTEIGYLVAALNAFTNGGAWSKLAQGEY